MSSPESGAAVNGEEPVSGGVTAAEGTARAPQPSGAGDGLAELEPELGAELATPVLPIGRVKINVELFHEELRRNNLRWLFWTVAMATVVFPTWGAFDYFLVPG